MIAVRPATTNDAYDLCLNLHSMTRSETDNAGIALDRLLDRVKGAAAAPGACAVDVDGDLAIIAWSAPLGPGRRATMFLAATCKDGRKLTIAARRWAARERAAHPRVEFVSTTFSTHPQRDRFLAALGMRKISERPGFALFSDS